MQKFKLLNNILGWVAFLFAATVYTLTMESSGSFWDCGEFVSGAWKLQVVHPPGAPFFLMLGRLFTLLAGGDPSKVALMVNWMSALSTAGAVMFTFWTVTALARKVIMKDGNYTDERTFTVLGAGLIAAASCTFVDSSWFSAVEGEVYALSQFFLSLIVWIMVKWDADDSPHADHWLVLIAYMTGLSIGVHLLSLLALPAIALIYYYKRFKTTTVGWMGTIAIGFLVLGLYMKFIISFTQSYLAGMDLFFVNTLGMGFNSGIVFGVALLVAVIVSLLKYTHSGSQRDFNIALGVSILYVVAGFIINDSWTARFIRLIFVGALFAAQRYGYETRRLVNIGVLAIAFSYVGYLSYIMVPIRSLANTPINMNRPTDPFSLKSYVDREQYGDRPLVKGPDYTASYDDIVGYKKTGERWSKNEKNGQYDYAGDKQDYEFSPESQMLFPRLGFWQEEGKKAGYRAWLNPEYNVVERGTKNVVKTFPPSGQRAANEYVAELNKENRGPDGRGGYAVKDAISFSDNIAYFFKYQVGYMYFRYLMWNFSGRQDDIQGTYGNDNGRWITGISFIDNSGMFFTPEWPQEGLSQSALTNKARNKFYMIPFIIGVIGLIYTLYRHEKIFWIILVLFGTAGLLQIIYQNEPPIEPRERDYAQAGSFIVFTMWMGFGMIALVDLFKRKLPEIPSVALAFLLCATAPILMGSQGWDDHNRHGRYTARDFAINYLESCAPNAVLFTQGDNDTYPLWYAQEVEGIRTDIRVINLSLLGVDWYIDQLRYKMNDAAPLKMSCTTEQYHGSLRDAVRYRPVQGISANTPVDLKTIMQFVASDDARNKDKESGENFYPTKTFYLDIDTNLARQKDMVSADEYNQLVPRIQWSIENSVLLKNDWMTLDIVANNIYDRPIYFAVSVAPDAYLGLDKYFQLEGLTYRVVPKLNQGGSPYSAPARTDVMYERMMTKFKFGGIESNPNIYLDENNQRMTVNIKGNYGRLAEALIAKGEKEKAANIIDYSLKNMPPPVVPHSVFDFSYPEVYYQAGQKEKARKLVTQMMAKAKDELNYYKKVYQFSLSQAQQAGDMNYYQQLQQGAFMERREVREQLYIMQEMTTITKSRDDAEFSAAIEKEFTDYRYSFVQMPKPQ
jgi:tetratricopeptide (TPR) repeat protein